MMLPLARFAVKCYHHHNNDRTARRAVAHAGQGRIDMPERSGSAGRATGSTVIRTPDQRLRVFVSSTLQEVVDERSAAREAITHLRLAPVMFELGARPHPPKDLYRAYLDQCHVFIGI